MPPGQRFSSSSIELKVQQILQGDPDEIINDTKAMCITRNNLRRFIDGIMLTDECINFYMNLLYERSQRAPQLPKCWFFNTFFYQFLERKLERVHRWTKSIDIFVMDMAFVPIHLGCHWTLATIDFKAKYICYYDSFHENNDEVFELLEKYLKKEYFLKNSCELDFGEWNYGYPESIPSQENGYDCGMFVCKYADYISQSKKLDFDQQVMPYFRKLIILEIAYPDKYFYI